MTEDYKTQNKQRGQVPSILPFLSQLSGDDGADCISDIYSLYNPKEDRHTESYGVAERGRLPGKRYGPEEMCAEVQRPVGKEENRCSKSDCVVHPTDQYSNNRLNCHLQTFHMKRSVNINCP